MSLFKQKVTSYLGVDLGTGSIKIVELENVAGRPQLVTYGMAEIETNVSRDEPKESQEKIAEILKTLVAKSRASTRAVVAALSNFSVFTSLISLPKLGQKELADAIAWEAKKFVPMPIEKVVLDWKVLNEEEGKKEKAGGSEPPGEQSDKKAGALRILLTAAPKHLIERYVNIFKLSGLNLLSLETESFALARALVGNDPAAVLIADIGSLTTDLTVVEKGVPVLARSIDVGGKTVTKVIADSMGVDPSRAEQFKRDVGLSLSTGAPADSTGGQDGVGQIVKNAFASVVNEMKYSLNLHEGQAERKVEKILITGGSAYLPSLTDYLSSELGIKAFVANPWARISYPKELKDNLDDIATRMAVAAGLAMREIE